MNKRAGAILLLLLGVFAAANAAEQVVPLPATLNRQAVGELNASVEDNQLRALDITPLLGQLRDLLPPGRFQLLPTNSAAPVTVAVLAAAGVQSRFNFQNLTVDLVIPAELKRTEVVNLVGTPDVTGVHSLSPAAFSAYMNVRGGVDYVESSQVGATGFGDPQLALENAFNFHGLVLENETAINPAPDKTWEKRDTRLIFDDPERRIRYTAGDLNYPVTSLQGFLPMAGFSLARENSLQRYRVTSPLGQSSFFLKQDSKVEVILNGHTVQTLQLAAGPQQLRNFPLTGGANNVLLRITDPVGRVEYVNATLFYDPGLLRAGESEFNYAVGFPSVTDPDSAFYHYDRQPAASAYHRWGLSDRLTLGFNAQSTADTQQGGVEASFSTLGGTFNLDLAFSRDRHIGNGTAQQLQYHFYPVPGSRFADGVFNVSVSHQSPLYTPPLVGAMALAHSDTWNFQARYSQRLNEHWSAGIGYSHQLAGHDTQLASYNLVAGYHGGRVNADVSLNRNSGSARGQEWTAFFTLRFDLERRQTLYSSYDTATHASRTEWQYTPPNNVESVGATLGVQTEPEHEDIYGNVQYWGRRAELLLSQNTLTSGDSATSLRWGTALVYADGQFGVSRPVLDSFALVRSADSLADAGGVGVQPLGQIYEGKEGWLGPAVLPEINSYYPQHVAVEPLQSDAEFDPQEGDFVMHPTYRSGTVIRVGHGATMDATARLLWPDGQPAALQVWSVTAPDGTTSVAVSDRAGVAYFSGLVPGPYTVKISDYPETQFGFTIAATKARVVSLGDLQVPQKP